MPDPLNDGYGQWTTAPIDYNGVPRISATVSVLLIALFLSFFMETGETDHDGSVDLALDYWVSTRLPMYTCMVQIEKKIL